MTITLTWTKTDESPRLASAVFLPIVQRVLGQIGVTLDIADISLAGRILAAQGKGPDDLARLGELARSGRANIVKLPNISASAEQIQACIAELNAQGEALPELVDEPTTEAEVAAAKAYDKVKGSAVNPVLREGNSDRRAPDSVKAQAKRHPHWMGEWTADRKTAVLTMDEGDFRHTEQSVTLKAATTVDIVHLGADGAETVLKGGLALEAGEIIDGACLRAEALAAFLDQAAETYRDQDDVCVGAHLKATMMKVSDPVIFGRVLESWFAPLIACLSPQIQSAGWKPQQGLGALLAAVDADGVNQVNDAISAGPVMAMADVATAKTTLHAPNTTIIDASMPAMIRAGGQMAGPDGVMRDAIAVIPDSSYAPLYQVIIEDCKANGAYDPATMGTVPNVGLMAKKGEEYGSHDKTFIIKQPGHVVIRDVDGQELTRHEVAPGDIWRACQTKEAPIRDWVRLALRRAKATGWPAVFWLDQTRAHDAQVLSVVSDELDRHDTEGITIKIMDVAKATKFTVDRVRRGENTISVSGNVLRDYLTDMFPIMELGTSSRMLSIVPLMAGGGLYETGAGGTAPLLVNQLLDENHLQWDSLGEYMALVPALEQIAEDHGVVEAKVVAKALDQGIEHYLAHNRSPKAEVGGDDTRTAGYWIARYWIDALASQDISPALAARFAPAATALAQGETTILAELLATQGQQPDLGGYYRPDPDRLRAVMAPSATFNGILASLDETVG